MLPTSGASLILHTLVLSWIRRYFLAHLALSVLQSFLGEKLPSLPVPTLVGVSEAVVAGATLLNNSSSLSTAASISDILNLKSISSVFSRFEFTAATITSGLSQQPASPLFGCFTLHGFSWLVAVAGI